jgi:hypothetical protein
MNTGGPAFPFGTAFSGMTLRDFFAAKAMQGLLSDSPSSSDVADAVNTLAHFSYTIADAMLKAREQ